jgi:hypothetical protein
MTAVHQDQAHDGGRWDGIRGRGAAHRKHLKKHPLWRGWGRCERDSATIGRAT